jgi:hypothetical protein
MEKYNGQQLLCTQYIYGGVFCKEGPFAARLQSKYTYSTLSTLPKIEIVAVAEVIPDFTFTSLELPSPVIQNYRSQVECVPRPPPVEGREGRHGSLLL